MSKNLILEYVSIDECPKAEVLASMTELTLGDLHANAVKLLYCLVRAGFFEISSAHYERIVEIYGTFMDTVDACLVEDKKLKAQQFLPPNIAEIKPQNDIFKPAQALLAEFDELLANIKVTNQGVLLRLLGDEVGDRGANDYFILKILEKLRKASVPYEILISNHALGFIEAYELAQRFEYPSLGMDQARSLYNLQKLIDHNLITRSQVVNLINYAYKPALKALSYSLDHANNTITLYSHAPVDLTIIKFLTEKFNEKYQKDLRVGITYQDESIEELAETIECINKEYTVHAELNFIHILYDRESIGCDPYAKPNAQNPFEMLTWNRDYEQIQRATKHKGYNIHYVHGHDATGVTDECSYWNLDNTLGKTSISYGYNAAARKIYNSNFYGEYTILVSDERKLEDAASFYQDIDSEEEVEILYDESQDKKKFNGATVEEISAGTIHNAVQQFSLFTLKESPSKDPSSAVASALNLTSL
ncbi:Dot/Icm T4SS effector Wip [Legionella septentrionalis]|uniref:Dot/Icm T4SS effector Wip n=1 Tax=Legionella septentrionalis TaxID=2498109 RepID=UPI000F8D0539|nr:Dot/Icm T4SS effector Wip [Legionella septentrionalis]RUR17506.1 hypothetical protein ELY10_00820 [Legionella septentrionalis]